MSVCEFTNIDEEWCSHCQHPDQRPHQPALRDTGRLDRVVAAIRDCEVHVISQLTIALDMTNANLYAALLYLDHHFGACIYADGMVIADADGIARFVRGERRDCSCPAHTGGRFARVSA